MAENVEDSALRVYCYRGKPKNVIYLWQTVSVSVTSNLITVIMYILDICVVPYRFGFKRLRHVSRSYAEVCFQRVRGATFRLVL